LCDALGELRAGWGGGGLLMTELAVLHRVRGLYGNVFSANDDSLFDDRAHINPLDRGATSYDHPLARFAPRARGYETGETSEDRRDSNRRHECFHGPATRKYDARRDGRGARPAKQAKR
jgi:hypothetical protein